MPIVSISLNDEILSELDKLQSSMGFQEDQKQLELGSELLFLKKNKIQIYQEIFMLFF